MRCSSLRGGWLEEATRGQALETYFGLPLTLSGDPRAAAAFALTPVAVAVAIDAAILALAVLAWRRHPVYGLGCSLAGLLAVTAPAGGWTVAIYVPVLLITLPLGFMLRRRRRRDRSSESAEPQAGVADQPVATAPSMARPWEEIPHDVRRTVGWLLLVLSMAAVVVIASWTPRAVGTAIGRHEAQSRSTYFVVGDRACHLGIALIDFGEDGGRRATRVAQQAPGQQRWTLLPGVFTIPGTEPLMEVKLRLAPSVAVTLPSSSMTRLPSLCG